MMKQSTPPFEKPAAVYNKRTGSLLYLGEQEQAEEWYSRQHAILTSRSFDGAADDLSYVELPASQPLIKQITQDLPDGEPNTKELLGWLMANQHTNNLTTIDVIREHLGSGITFTFLSGEDENIQLNIEIDDYESPELPENIYYDVEINGAVYYKYRNVAEAVHRYAEILHQHKHREIK